MKKFYVLSIILLSFSTLSTQNINFPDANFKTKLVIQSNPVVDINNDDEISVAEAEAVTGRLKIRGNGSTGRIEDLTGIEFFINATEIEADNNLLTTVDLSNNTALTFISLNSNNLTSIDFSNNTALEFISIGSNNLSALDVSNLTNLQVLSCNNMLMTALDVTNCTQLEELDCAINQFPSLDLSTNTALRTLIGHSLPNLASIDVSNNTLLEQIDLSGASFSDLDVSNNSLLTTLDVSFGQVTNLVFGLNNALLSTVRCEQSPLATIDTSQLTGLTELYLNDSQFTTIDVSQNTNLQVLELDDNQLTTIDLESNPNLNVLKVESNQLQTAYLRNGNNFELGTLRLRWNPELYCVFVDNANMLSSNWFRGGAVTFLETEAECDIASQVTLIPDINFEQELIVQGYDSTPANGETPTSKINVITELDVSLENISDLTGLEAFTSLVDLDCSFNPIVNLDVSGNDALEILTGNFMDLESITFGANPNLSGISLNENQLESIDVSQLSELGVLRLGDNNITTLDVSNNLMLSILDVYDNPITALDLRNNNMRLFNSRNTFIETLDFSNSDDIISISIQNNPALTYLNLKNGGNDDIQSIFSITFSGLPNLQTACVDDVNNLLASRIQSQTAQVVTLTEDCLNEISGDVFYDVDANGCDTSDIALQNIMIESASVVDTTATVTSLSGSYVNFVSANTYMTRLVSALPSYFTVTNQDQTSTFTDFDQQDAVDFCISANQDIDDLNLTLIPTTEARPGFNVNYRLVYNNIGTASASGTFTLDFDDSKLTFLSSTVTPLSQMSNSLTFDFTDLNPFESHFVNLEFNVFTPPTVNDADILVFTASIDPSTNDFTPEDNTYRIEQIVVNSFDPNDKQVLQGETIFEEEVENYLDYLVRFQNTGSASAINVRIEDRLDDNLDWTTFQPLASSHDYVVRITNDNFIEFIFDDINLPDQATSEELSQGYIAFRIKPKNTLVVGDVISGFADIFFDFNAPITTNTVTTEIVAPLSTNDFERTRFQLYPNPAKDELTISSSKPIENISVYDFNGRRLRSVAINSPSYVLDVSNFIQGLYFVEIQALGSKSIQKFIKN